MTSKEKRILSELVEESDLPRDYIVLRLAENGWFNQYASEVQYVNKNIEPSITEDEFNKIINNKSKYTKKDKKEEK